MDYYTEIRNKIRAMTGQKTPLLLTGKVESVDGDTCTVSVGDLRLTGVRLRSVVNNNESKILITPEPGSYVTLIDLSGELRELEVIGYSEIKAIDIETSGDINIRCKGDTNLDCDGTVTFNGGDNDGLVMIKDLTDRLNKLVDEFNSHTHSGAFAGTINGTAATGTVTLTGPRMRASQFYKSQYEDIKVKH